ncbi:MAG: ABC transporter substrate-binding protein, partial [Pseudomonadota bacterium]
MALLLGFMVIRKVLIFTPILVIVFLIQSYFWVPTYEQQTRGNPDRLNEFITASIGDASVLNPILSADSASSDISGMVFEGLLDRDEELLFRGRLATSWSITEEAFFYVNERVSIPEIQSSDAEGVVSLLQKAKTGDLPVREEVQTSLDHVKEITMIPPRSFSVSRPVKGVTKDGRAEKVMFQIKAPARIRLVLNKVDQDLFKNLESILGKDYFASFSPGNYITPVQPQASAFPVPPSVFEELLPATEHNPILLFHLRPNVTFHDGHKFDAYDVKFTYESIMNPQNLSPRVSDYEPVKQVDVIDPLTVRITYKRLYSPALGTWGMGILPEHLLNAKTLRQEALRLKKDPENFSLRQSGFNRHPVGCGPFVFKEWRSDQYITLKRFDHYWEGPPNYRGYVYRIIPDLLTQ